MENYKPINVTFRTVKQTGLGAIAGSLLAEGIVHLARFVTKSADGNGLSRQAENVLMLVGIGVGAVSLGIEGYREAKKIQKLEEKISWADRVKYAVAEPDLAASR